jgi:hypothetical protein
MTDSSIADNIGTMAETLGTFEQAVLLAIVRLREDAYGRATLREVQERLGREVAAGPVHATLEIECAFQSRAVDDRLSRRAG